MSGATTTQGTSDPPQTTAEDDLEGYRDELKRLAQTDLRTSKYAEKLLELNDV